jgi:hypothetical protein
MTMRMTLKKGMPTSNLVPLVSVQYHQTFKASCEEMGSKNSRREGPVAKLSDPPRGRSEVHRLYKSR